MRMLCTEAGYTMKHTEEPADFNPKILSIVDVVVFLNTTGDVLNDAQQQAFEAWFQAGDKRSGGDCVGFLGIHSAADTEYDWPFYQSMLGGHFTGHPPVQQAVVMCENDSHPATRMLPERWSRVDEWYNYAPNPRHSGASILLTLDVSSYHGSTMADDHPIAWCREVPTSGGGSGGEASRMFYTGGGHTIESFGEPLFRQHLLAALRWVAHDIEGD